MQELRPQPGPQSRFMRCSANVCVYGGAAGGGKSYGLLLDACRWVDTPGYAAVIFRRTYPEITMPGGLWDTAVEIVTKIGGKPNRSRTEFVWPNGSRLSLRAMQYASDVYRWQGGQIPYIAYDEGTHFAEHQVMYLMTRNRSMTGVPAQMRITCNPDANSWLTRFLSWWIDQDTGYPIVDRAGKVRWFYREGDDYFWYGSKAEAMAAHPDLALDRLTGHQTPPKSVTFIPAKLSDNAIFCSRNPEYRANLLSQSFVERSRLLDGNWKITAADGMFRAEWFAVGQPPSQFKRVLRAWDFAATEATDKNDPDYTVGIKMGLAEDGKVWILDVHRVRYSPQRVRDLYLETARTDGPMVEIIIEQEPGSAGKIVASDLKAALPGYNVRIDKPDARSGDKVTRAQGLSAAAERGEVLLALGSYTKTFVAELVEFPYGSHDDQVDAASSAYRRLTGKGRAILVF